MKSLRVEALKTRVFEAGEDLISFIQESLPGPLSTLENRIVVITSKIVSLAERQTCRLSDQTKKQLVQQESDVYLGEIGYGCFLTIKQGLLIPSAGIDESNSASGEYILFPKDPTASAWRIWHKLRERGALTNVGVLLTDSHTTPLRAGVTGIALAYAGFRGVQNLVGQPDLFGRPLKMTRINRADALAASAVVCMGEGSECRPLALVDADVTFESNPTVVENELSIPYKEDLYYPLYRQLLTTVESIE